MKKFSRRRGVITTELSSYEVALLASLINQLIELVSDGQPERYVAGTQPEETFDELVRELTEQVDQPEEPQDPVLKRLFPNAYPDDPAASSDFRRFTERSLREKKISEATTVLQRLAETEQGAHPLRIPPAEAEAWLRTLTSIRLAVATRLGITDAEAADALNDLPDDDPRAFMVSVYDWLGFAEETLINAL
jgi:Domain of unknown function (DUF2017)